MATCIHVEILSIHGDARDCIGYCRLNVSLCTDWTELLSEIATKCHLPHVFVLSCEPVCDGRSVAELSELRHGAVLTLSYYVTDDIAADWRSASASLATDEHLYLQSIEESDKARKDELARRAADDAAYVAKMIAEERAVEKKPLMFECPICRDDLPVDGCVSLACNHRYCKDCFEGYLESKINEKAIDEKTLKCAIPDCNTAISSHEVLGNVSAALNEKYLNFAAEVSIEADPNHVRCPKCSLLTIFPPKRKFEDMWRKAECPNHNCKHKFCALCKDKQHDGTCEAYAKWKEENGLADEAFIKLMKAEEWAKCPHCGMPCVKEEGCFFMTCKPPCSRQFCYLCGCKLTEKEHYSHFPKGPYNKPCLNTAGKEPVPAAAPQPRPIPVPRPRHVAVRAAQPAPAVVVPPAPVQPPPQRRVARR